MKKIIVTKKGHGDFKPEFNKGNSKPIPQEVDDSVAELLVSIGCAIYAKDANKKTRVAIKQMDGETKAVVVSEENK